MESIATVWQVLGVAIACTGLGFFMGWLRSKYKTNNTEW